MEPTLKPKRAKYVPIAVLSCPCCTKKKKPFNSFRNLNIHLAKHHPDYPYKIILKDVVHRSGNKIVQGEVIVRTRKSRK